MDYDISWLCELGLDTAIGISYTGGKDRYISALSRYYRNYIKTRAQINEYYTTKDYENFGIKVHALKSNSRMIGAMALGDAFEELEMAARNNDTDTINKKTAIVLADYAALIEKLQPIGELGEVRAAGEITAPVARDTADSLLAALDDFDVDLSKELAVKLSGYPFRMTQAAKLKEAIGYIDDFMYDEAADIIRDICAAIEN